MNNRAVTAGATVLTGQLNGDYKTSIILEEQTSFSGAGARPLMTWRAMIGRGDVWPYYWLDVYAAGIKNYCGENFFFLSMVNVSAIKAQRDRDKMFVLNTHRTFSLAVKGKLIL